MSEDYIDKIAKQLPVRQAYDDAVSPAAKQMGVIGEDVVKSLRLALAPLQLTAALQDRFARFIDKSVRNVPESRRVAPPPQIIGPILEGIRYEPEDTPIDEMFSILLSNAMDSENLEKAHPSFPIIIRQLSRDEAVILRELKSHTFTTTQTLEKNPKWNADQNEPFWINPKVEEVLDFPLSKLIFPRNFTFYGDHLYHLGLTGFSEKRTQESIRDASGTQTGTRKFLVFHLMPLGRSLLEACIRDGTEPNETMSGDAQGDGYDGVT